eukprot:TRINITY_DN36169_c0_g1_i1.p1 TRINITY_DN36169_c0_g1~~TRINITY_DN36169_c0_g1_i1.p1  ORF type:complete len:720 (-),score=90.64 TRINITY_DN36169_c0_g1_i1:47-2206(-)
MQPPAVVKYILGRPVPDSLVLPRRGSCSHTHSPAAHTCCLWQGGGDGADNSAWVGAYGAKVVLLRQLLSHHKRAHRMARHARGGQEMPRQELLESLRWSVDPRWKPSGDQPQAIQMICKAFGERSDIRKNVFVTLEGATGTGKTFTMASVIARMKMPVLLFSSNKVLARQLREQLRHYLPNMSDSIGLFLSHYKSYTPEHLNKDGELVKSRWEIDPDSSNDKAESVKLVKSERPCIIVASSSAIYPLRDHSQSLVELFKESYGSEWLMILDESHLVLQGLQSPSVGAKKRQEPLIDAGYRSDFWLPLSLDELWKQAPSNVLFASATPGETEKDLNTHKVKMIQRPTHILDPEIEIKIYEEHGFPPTLKEDVTEVVFSKQQQVFLICRTKDEAKLIAKHWDKDFRIADITCDHSLDERVQLLDKFNQGKLDVLVGVNLLREGVDIPSVAVIIILDADAGGFLRSKAALTQFIGRAARNANGRAILYARKTTENMEAVVDETKVRRELQKKYNSEHMYEPASVTPSSDRRSHTDGKETNRMSLSSSTADRTSTAASDQAVKEGAHVFKLCHSEDKIWKARARVWEAKAKPEQRVLQLALAGMEGDEDIRGVPGIGRCLASSLLDAFSDLNELFATCKKQTSVSVKGIGPIRLERLQNHRKAVLKNVKGIRDRQSLHKMDQRMMKKAPHEALHQPCKRWSSEGRRILKGFYEPCADLKGGPG